MRALSTRFLLLLATAALGSLAVAASAYACACCAEPGTWSQTTAPVAAHELTELGRLRFGVSASTFFTAAGEDAVHGIEPVAARYRVTQARSGRRWTLTFRDAAGNSGTLRFSVPARTNRLAVDLRDGRRSAGGGPLLYREWRLDGPVAGTGIFATGTSRPARFRLVLQGRGNACVNGADFRSWILQVRGPRADFGLYGGFAKISP